jgi:hypothetical protein
MQFCVKTFCSDDLFGFLSLILNIRQFAKLRKQSFSIRHIKGEGKVVFVPYKHAQGL